MADLADSYQVHAARVADYILCTNQPYVRYSSLIDCVPSATTPEEVERFQNALKFDEYDRFCYIEERDDLLIGLKYLSDEDTQIQEEVEWWRSCIAQYLERVGVPIELGRIASHVERPINVPRNIRLKDILNADCMNRFCIHGAPDRLMVARKVSADEVEESKEIWRKRVHDFLYLQPRDVTLTTIGSSVARPGNLVGKQNKLIEVLTTDPEERFHLIYRSPTETIVRVKLSDAQREWLHEKWRLKAVHCLLEQQRSMALTELGSNVKRPSIHLGAPASLRNVLMEDPQGRFILSGQADAIRVRLSSMVYVGRSAEADALAAGHTEWSQVTKKTHSSASAANEPKTLSSSPSNASSSTKGKQKLKHQRTTAEELQLLSARQERWNAKPSGTATATATAAPSLSLQLPSYGDCSSGETTAASDYLNSDTYTMRSHSNSWEWKSPLEEAMKHAGLMDEAPGAPQLSTPGAPRTAPHSAPRASYKEKLAPGLNSMKVIARPTPAPYHQAHNEASTYAAVYVPGSNPGSAIGSPVPYIPARPRPHPDAVLIRTKLSEWLPTVLTDFKDELVQSFVARLNSEGFLCVKDLVVARSLGQLSAEFLGQVGLKMGHCNRIFGQLPTITVNQHDDK